MAKSGTKGTSRLLSQSSESLTPSSYTLHEALIKPNKPVNGNETLDITGIITKFNIIEDLNNPFIEAVFTIIDANNLIETLQLIGNEEIKILLKRSPKKESSQDDAKWELNLKIAEIFGYVRHTASKQFYKIRCASTHIYSNQGKVLQRPFKNTIGTLVEDIVKKDLAIEKHDIDSSSKGIIKGIYPTLKPLAAISWLLRNASEDGSHFYFYENIVDGIKLKSYKKLLEEEVYDTYEFKPTFKFELGTPESYDEVRRRIRKLVGNDGVSKLTQISKGVYASSLFTIDTAEKKFEKFIFNYDNKELQKVNKFKPFSDEDKILGQKYSDLKNARHHHVNLNSGSFPGFDNYHQPLQPTLLKQIAQFEGLEEQEIQIQIPGDFELCVGKVIQLDVVKAGDTEELEEATMIDKNLSGKYIICRIDNRFSNEFVQALTIKRDSMGVDINAG